ncbi:MAG: DUF4878 domain-containing protein [bacterium]
MRRLLYALAVVIMIIGVISCSDSSKSPKSVANKYVKAMVSDDYKTMVDYLYIASPEVDKQQYIDFLEGMSDEIDDDQKTLSMDYVSETISDDGTTANVTFFVKQANGDESEFDLHMIKVDDQWFVDSGK